MCCLHEACGRRLYARREGSHHVNVRYRTFFALLHLNQSKHRM